MEKYLLPAKADDGSLNAYIRKVNAIPMLTLEEENELTERLWKHMDFAAAHRLVLSHLRLVVKIAQSFTSYSVPMQDMISEGNIGLMKAVQKFSPEAGCRLVTYATWWIRAAIQEYIVQSVSFLKSSAKNMKEKLFYKFSHHKTLSTDVPLRVLSLDEKINDNDALIEHASDNYSHAEEIILQNEKTNQQSLLQKCISKLNNREKDILYRRQLKEEPDKLKDIANEYGISQERVRQIEKTTIEKLRKYLTCTTEAFA